MSHKERYSRLIAHLDDFRQTDNYYTAACYLLSYDEKIAKIAEPYVGCDAGGSIDFPQIIGVLKTNEQAQIIVGTAYSLFGCAAKSAVTPHDIATLPCPWLELVTNAMYISQGQAAVLVQDNALCVSFDKYQRTRGFVAAMGSEIPSNVDMVASLCRKAKERASEQNQRPVDEMKSVREI